MTASKTIRFAVLAIFTGFAFGVSAQQSVLKSGNWFKLSVEKEGVYKINFDLLKKIGIDPGKTDPRKIKIYGNSGGMLPQENSTARPYDLQENAIHVSGEGDGKFDNQDFILFYAQSADLSAFNTGKDIYYYQKNLYSDKNFYFLTVGETEGKRIATAEDAGAGFPVVSIYNDYVHHETDDYNDRHSGREWFGEKFGLETNEHEFFFNISGILPGTALKLVSDVVGKSTSNSSIKLFLNNVQVAEQQLLPISANQYGVKGIHRRDTLLISTNDVSAATSTTQRVKYQFVKNQSSSLAYLDFFLLSFERTLALYNDQTIFLSKKSLGQPVSTFEIGAVPADATIWDITDPNNVSAQAFSATGQAATFSTATDQLKKFIVFNTNIPAPDFVEKVLNQDLHGLTTPNLIIVTHPTFISEANRLAAHRGAFSNLSVHVVTTSQIYNEFASGRQDVSAVRDFVKNLYDKNPSVLKALLLFGRGSYDYKDRVPNNSNYVITYESRNSLHPLQTFSSDDYFAFLEDNEGYWGESPAQNHTLDIGVGRLPVRTISEAKNIVDKIIDYDTNKTFGSWRKQIVFIADDGNGEDGYTSLHQYQADQLAETIEDLDNGADVRKLFMGSYVKTVKPNGATVPKLTDDVIRAFDKGALIINYTGHGSEDQWGDENFFNTQTITELRNKLYPFLVTATCEFGRNDDPAIISGAEKCVTLANAGAIGMVTTARPVNATTNFNLNEAFYEALFQREGNSYMPVGEVFRKTKNNSTSGVSNRNFALLGDPSMTLALPPNVVTLTSITTALGSDTLKALSTVIAKGEIRDFGGQKLTGFNGVLEATLSDKETISTTIGRNNPAFTYNQWNSALFRGRASVKDGEFQITFVIPKNIAYQIAEGRFSMYAFDPDSNTDASGFATNFKVGSSEEDVIADTTPPEIVLFMGDTTFVNGGITAPDTHLVAHLKDNTGINISSYGIGNSIIAVLDDDADTFILNDYYVADTDDFTSGKLTYPVKDLSPGKHKLTIKAWDVHNNSAASTIEFIVTDGESLVIESFGNYPNPFRENTTLFFTHNRPGDDLQAQVFIQKTSGEVIKSDEMMISGSDYRVNLLELNAPDDMGKKLSAGLYLARVIVRSLTNGSKNERVTKLIILN